MSEQRRLASGLEIAVEWSKLPPEVLEAALKALEPELAREHERIMMDKHVAAAEATSVRAHRLYLLGLIAGFMLISGMLTGAVSVGIQGYPWLAALLAGPSMLSLGGLFVLRKIDSGAMRAVHRSQTASLNAANMQSQANPPQSLGPAGPGGMVP